MYYKCKNCMCNTTKIPHMYYMCITHGNTHVARLVVYNLGFKGYPGHNVCYYNYWLPAPYIGYQPHILVTIPIYW